MSAQICTRCGKGYQNEKTFIDISILTYEKLDDGTFRTDSDYVGLCPECMNAFWDFLNDVTVFSTQPKN